jgi:glutamate--cysteine ligase
VKISNFILQEGIPTADRVGGLVAEPVMYIVNGEICGGFFRTHDEKSDNENLNSPGMKFVRICFAEKIGYTNEFTDKCDPKELDLLYDTVSQIAAISAALELKQ